MRHPPSTTPSTGSAERSVAVANLDGADPYHSSDEHLWEELRRIDQLVRAQTVRWRLTIAASKPASLWGMVHVTDAEVDAYLASEFPPLHRHPVELEVAMAPYVAAADDARRRIEARLQATPVETRLTLRRLREAFHLSRVELDALLVCVLPELDARYRRLYGYLQDDVSQTSPPVELMLQILHPVAAGVAGRDLLQAGPLLTNRLLVVPDERQDPRTLAARPVRVDDRIVAHLLGSDTTDRRLGGILDGPLPPLGWDEVAVEPEQLARLRRLAEWMKRRDPAESAPVVLLEGSSGNGRMVAAQAFCAAAGLPLLVARVATALHAAEPFDQMVDLCFREATLRDAALYWAGCEALLEPGQPRHRWDYLVEAAESFTGPTLLATTLPWDPVDRFHARPFIRYAFGMPDYQLRQQLWERCLPAPSAFAEPAPARSELAEHLANGFRLTCGQTLDALVAAHAEALRRDPMDPRLTVKDLREGCRRQSGRLGHLARRVEPRAGRSFDDLILPPASQRQLDEVRHRIRHHGRVHSDLGFERQLPLCTGLVAMFTGASGTGKTMAAELLAGEHGVDLYKVDLSAVVSKWVGETEKHLSQLFGEAEDANAILFFDEADALFGKRGEVRDARDRWANIEVNYLLQRIEEFPGPVILASNLSQNIDEAFLRRIHAIVDFPFPDADARLRIWHGMFPAGLQHPADEELKVLADRFHLPGGSIRNIVIDAAFRALADGNSSPVPAMHLRHLALSTAREYSKLGKPITRSEFGEELYAWAEHDLFETGR